MSKRALKRRITETLSKRNRINGVINAYLVVAYDQDKRGPLADLAAARIVELEQMRNELQALAERLASDVPGDKVTYSGLWLHQHGHRGMDF